MYTRQFVRDLGFKGSGFDPHCAAKPVGWQKCNPYVCSLMSRYKSRYNVESLHSLPLLAWDEGIDQWTT